MARDMPPGAVLMRHYNVTARMEQEQGFVSVQVGLSIKTRKQAALDRVCLAPDIFAFLCVSFLITLK